MDFNEVQTCKRDLQRGILVLIQQFEETTGAEVSDIRLDTAKVLGVNRSVIQVRVTVEVP